VLAKVRALDPDSELWVLTSTVSSEALDAARELGATALAVGHLAVSNSSMSRAASAGLDVVAWTVNTQKEADRLRSLGVAAICTDNPTEIH
jgi:glycerophosphoryl diester phosphodiesterase